MGSDQIRKSVLQILISDFSKYDTPLNKIILHEPIITGSKTSNKWTFKYVQNLREQYRNGTLVGLYERENVEDVVK